MYKSIAVLGTIIGIIVVLFLPFDNYNGDFKEEVNLSVLRKETFVNSITSIPITKYYVDNANVHAGYVNNSLYLNDDEFFFMSDIKDGLNLYGHSNITNGDIKITNELNKDVYKDADFFGLTPVLDENRNLFYSVDNVIKKYIPRTGNEEVVLKLDNDETLWAPLHVTKDGKWLSTTIRKKDVDGTFMSRIDVEHSKISYLRSPFIGTDRPIASHAQIHPTNPNIIMFAHEGSWVMDRMWIWNINENKSYNFYKHPDYTEMGHEMWLPDGSGVFIVQYGSVGRKIQSGINFFNTNGDLVDEVKQRNSFFLMLH